MNIISDELHKLELWTHDPDPSTLEERLNAVSLGDLMIAMTAFENAPAGMLAWAEFGRRKGFFQYKITMVESQGTLSVRLTGPAVPTHEMPIFEVKA